MPSFPDNSETMSAVGRHRRLLAASKLCGLVVALLGFAVLAGWQFDIPVLRSISPAWTAMQPWTALCFILSGGALLFAGVTAVRELLAITVAVIAGVLLWESISGTTLGVDTLLYPKKVVLQPVAFPGRTAEISAAELLLFSAAMVLAQRPSWQRSFQVVAVAGLTLAVVLLTGYLFRVPSLSSIGSYTPIALHTALGFLVLFAGVHLSQPHVGLAAMLVSPRLGGATARRILPLLMGLPIAVGLLVEASTGNGTRSMALPLTLVLLMAGLALVVSGMARQLDAGDREREAAVQAMRRSETLFRATQEASLFGMVILDPIHDPAGGIVDFRHRYVNPAALKLMGVAATDPDASALLSHCSAHADGTLLRQYVQALETGLPMDRQFTTSKGDRRRWFRAVAVKLDGGVAVSFFETTGQKEAERALARAEARYRSVVDTAVDAMVVIDERGVIQAMNLSAERIFGYPAGEALGRNVSMLMPEPYASNHDRFLENYRRTGIRKIIGIGREVEGRRKDGSTFPLELSIAEWFDGDQRFFTGIMRDITQRKKGLADLQATTARLELALDGARVAEERAKAAKTEAEHANQAKSRFLAAASHDLRQPVQALMLLSEALSSRLQDHPAGAIIASMQASLNALRMLLDGLLDVSRLDAGVVNASPQLVPMGPILERLAKEYAVRAKAKGLAFRAVPTGAWVETDPLLIERILRNLLENALRYTNQGKVLLGCRRHGGLVRLYVIDTGIGIAPEHRQVIFQEFFQVGNVERDREKGLGLGLSIVKRLTAILGHRLDLVSEPGRGSCFILDLPRVAGAAERPEDASGQMPGLGPALRLLVIDDEAIIRKSLGDLLQAWGYAVVVTGDVDEAVRRITEQGCTPDLIIADYRLRDGQTGLEAIEAVRRVCGKETPAVVLTGDTAPDSIAAVQASGAHIAHKPVAPENLQAILRFALAAAK